MALFGYKALAIPTWNRICQRLVLSR